MILKETIKRVIEAQRNTLERLDQGTPREAKARIEDSFALVITGVRRCGKSTFLNQIMRKQDGYYLNLEDPRLDGFDLQDFSKAEEIMKELYGQGGTYFLDEIQNVDKWEKFVRHLTDKKEKVVITGSNASLLSRELGTKLTGRHIQTEMFPFSYTEFLAMRKQEPGTKTFSDYLEQGGFPEYLKKKNPEIPQELLSDILIKDIAVRFGIKNTPILNKLAIHLISNVGKEFSYNSLKKAYDVKSVQSVIDYISHFENAYLIFTIPRFSYSYKKQQVLPKKAYSIDNGFSYNNTTSFSKDKGKMLENMVFLALRRKHKNIFYFHEERECDFIIKEKEKITSAIQVCYNLSEDNKKREVEGLLAALKKFNLRKGHILTYDQEDRLETDNKNIIVKPAWKWLLD